MTMLLKKVKIQTTYNYHEYTSITLSELSFNLRIAVSRDNHPGIRAETAHTTDAGLL
jgi:hypothetical protein